MPGMHNWEELKSVGDCVSAQKWHHAMRLPKLRVHKNVSTCSDWRGNKNSELVQIKTIHIIPKKGSGRHECLIRIHKSFLTENIPAERVWQISQPSWAIVSQNLDANYKKLFYWELLREKKWHHISTCNIVCLSQAECFYMN